MILNGCAIGFYCGYKLFLGAVQVKNSSAVTYDVMQKVIKQYLTAEEASLFLPILEMDRTLLGK
jgi:hypothetical protein